jgi:hypothetical protein
MVMLSTRFCFAPTSSSHAPRRRVFEEELRNVAAGGDLRHADVAPLQCLGERDVVGLGLHSGEERKEGQVLEDLGLAQGELLQRVCDLIGHVVPPSQHLEGGTDMDSRSA